jgi:hypothetical protein
MVKSNSRASTTWPKEVSFYMDPFRPEKGVYPPSLQPHLEESLMEMTCFTSQVGRWITKLCDVYLEQQGVKMQRSLFGTLESCVNAKARLLHWTTDQSQACYMEFISKTTPMLKQLPHPTLRLLACTFKLVLKNWCRSDCRQLL